MGLGYHVAKDNLEDLISLPPPHQCWLAHPVISVEVFGSRKLILNKIKNNKLSDVSVLPAGVSLNWYFLASFASDTRGWVCGCVVGEDTGIFVNDLNLKQLYLTVCTLIHWQ